MEPISLTTVVSAAGGSVIVPFINKVLGPAADELGLILGERIRMFRLQNQIKLFQEAQQMLKTAGISPQQVGLKTLLPLMEGASIEDDPSLAQKWSALLANAANPQSLVTIEPSFAEVLKQLTTNQAHILQMAYDAADPTLPKEQWLDKSAVPAKDILAKLSLSVDQYEIAAANLQRLQLCTNLTDVINGKITFYGPYNSICLGGYGYAFITACTPPVQ